MTRFVVVWAGQLVSQLGSALTTFALAVWIYQRTGDPSDLARLAVAAYLPLVLVAPLGGVLADRVDRRLVMLVADAGAAAATLAMWWCVDRGSLDPWLATALVAASSSCSALQGPAYEAAIVAIVPPAQLGRASGLVELSRGVAQLGAPITAGALFGAIGLRGILVVDLASFVVGLVTLAALRPSPSQPRARLRDGWDAIASRPGLVAMLALFAATSFTFAVVELALKPLVLATSTPRTLGVILSMVGVGMVVGAITLAAWGGPRRRIRAVFLFQAVEGGSLVLAGVAPDLATLHVAAFAYGVVIPLTFGCARPIWQLAVPLELQGRVSALRNAIVMLAIPLGYAIAPAAITAFGHAGAILVMGIVTWVAAIAAFAYRPYRALD